MIAHKPDYLIFALVSVLVLFGLVMVFSASYYTYAVKSSTDGFHVLRNQTLYAAMSIAVMVVVLNIPYTSYLSWRKIRGKELPVSIVPALAVLASVVLLMLVLMSDADLNGAKRWIKIGPVSVQPSEVGRFSMILFVADEFGRKKDALQQRKDFVTFIKAFHPSFLVAVGICSLILAGSNLSMTAATGLTFICMCIAIGINWRFVILMVVGAVGLGVLFTVTKSYRMKRAAIFLNPFSDPTGDGYQVVQSLYALGNGGLTGVGLGESTQKFLYLTYGDSDFILAIIGEELGLIGLIALLLVYAALILRGLRCANRSSDSRGLCLATGIVSAIAVQLIINVAVCTSSIPPTGVPLPFISAGGTSMLIFMAEAGILLNTSRYTVSLT